MEISLEQAFTAGAGIAGFMAGLFFRKQALKRMASGDAVEVRKDQAEIDLFTAWKETAQEERTRADEAYKERNRMAEEIAAMKVEAAWMKKHVAALELKVIGYERQIVELTNRLDAAIGRK